MTKVFFTKVMIFFLILIRWPAMLPHWLGGLAWRSGLEVWLGSLARRSGITDHTSYHYRITPPVTSIIRALWRANPFNQFCVGESGGVDSFHINDVELSPLLCRQRTITFFLTSLFRLASILFTFTPPFVTLQQWQLVPTTQVDDNSFNVSARSGNPNYGASLPPDRFVGFLARPIRADK
jgi:hypothetical protein